MSSELTRQGAPGCLSSSSRSPDSAHLSSSGWIHQAQVHLHQSVQVPLKYQACTHMKQALPPLLVVEASTSPIVGGTLVDSGLNPAGTAGGALELVPTIALEVNIFVAQKVTGCLDKLHIQSPIMQMKWLAQKTLYTNAALLTRSLGKPSITPTQAKKLVTRGIDFHTLLLLGRTSDAFVAERRLPKLRRSNTFTSGYLQ